MNGEAWWGFLRSYEYFGNQKVKMGPRDGWMDGWMCTHKDFSGFSRAHTPVCFLGGRGSL